MTRSLRLGIRSLIRDNPTPADRPPGGQRALVARVAGWFDVAADGTETPLGSGLRDQASPPADETIVQFPYLRFVRDADGDVQYVYIGTED